MPRNTKNVRLLGLGRALIFARAAFGRSRLRNIVVSAAIGSALIATVAVTRHPTPTYPVYDGSGERLDSLFTGIAPDEEAKAAFLRDGARGPSTPCQEAPEFVRRLASWIDPPSVSAYSCGSACSGHHMYYETRPCPTGCNTVDRHNFHYSSPNRSPWQIGRREIGELTCGECGPCAESSCTNWY